MSCSINNSPTWSTNSQSQYDLKGWYHTMYGIHKYICNTHCLSRLYIKITQHDNVQGFFLISIVNWFTLKWPTFWNSFDGVVIFGTVLTEWWFLEQFWRNGDFWNSFDGVVIFGTVLTEWWFWNSFDGMVIFVFHFIRT